MLKGNKSGSEISSRKSSCASNSTNGTSDTAVGPSINISSSPADVDHQQDQFRKLSDMNANLHDQDVISFMSLRAILEKRLGRETKLTHEEMSLIQKNTAAISERYKEFLELLSKSVQMKFGAATMGMSNRMTALAIPSGAAENSSTLTLIEEDGTLQVVSLDSDILPAPILPPPIVSNGKSLICI